MVGMIFPANSGTSPKCGREVMAIRRTIRAWGFWAGRYEKTQGPYALQLHALKALCDTLGGALSLETLIEQCRTTLQQCPSLGEPIWADESQVQTLRASCRLALARHAKRFAVEEMRSIEAPLPSLAGKANAHPLTNEVLQAIRHRDVDACTRCSHRIQDLERERQSVQQLDEGIKGLRRHVPRLVQALEQTCYDPGWEVRMQQVQGAWRWAQARFWVAEYIRQEDAPSLAKRAKQRTTVRTAMLVRYRLMIQKVQRVLLIGDLKR